MALLRYLEAHCGGRIERFEIIVDNARPPENPASSTSASLHRRRRRHQNQSVSVAPNNCRPSYKRRASHPQPQRSINVRPTICRWDGAPSTGTRDQKLTPVSRRRYIGISEPSESNDRAIHSLSCSFSEGMTLRSISPTQEDFILKIPSRSHSPPGTQRQIRHLCLSPEQEEDAPKEKQSLESRLSLIKLAPPLTSARAAHHPRDVRPRMPAKTPSNPSLLSSSPKPSSSSSKRWLILDNIDRAIGGSH